MTPGVRLRPWPEFVATWFLELTASAPFAGVGVLGWAKFGVVVVATVPVEGDESALAGEAVMPVIPIPAAEGVGLPEEAEPVGFRKLASRGDRLAAAAGPGIVVGVSGKD